MAIRNEICRWLFLTSMRTYPRSAEILGKNREFIPGGVVSLNRAIEPEIVFVRGQGAYIWDAEGNQYIDYHAAFAPHFLGHNDPYVTEVVIRTLRDLNSLYGTGTTVLDTRCVSFMNAARCSRASLRRVRRSSADI